MLSKLEEIALIEFLPGLKVEIFPTGNSSRFQTQLCLPNQGISVKLQQLLLKY